MVAKMLLINSQTMKQGPCRAPVGPWLANTTLCVSKIAPSKRAFVKMTILTYLVSSLLNQVAKTIWLLCSQSYPSVVCNLKAVGH